MFWVLYLILAIPATVASTVASRRGELGHPDGGKRFLLALYGLPFIIVPIGLTQPPQAPGSKRQAQLDLPTRRGVTLSQP